jgi:hypothetical protein
MLGVPVLNSTQLSSQFLKANNIPYQLIDGWGTSLYHDPTSSIVTAKLKRKMQGKRKIKIHLIDVAYYRTTLKHSGLLELLGSVCMNVR